MGSVTVSLNDGVDKDFATGSEPCWVFILVLPLALGSLNNGQSNAVVLGLMLAQRGVDRTPLKCRSCRICLLVQGLSIAVGLLLAVVYPRRLTPELVVALAVGRVAVCSAAASMFRAIPGWFHLGGDDRQTWPVEQPTVICGYCSAWWTLLAPAPTRSFSFALLPGSAFLAAILANTRRTAGRSS